MVDASDSMLAGLGNIVAPLFIPLGWGTWEAAVATLTGLAAKENVVGTFGVLYGFHEVAEDGAEIWVTFKPHLRHFQHIHCWFSTCFAHHALPPSEP